MNNRSLLRALGVIGLGLAMTIVTTHSALGLAPYVIKAKTYRVFMVRAMDQCNPATVSVVGPGEPTGGCPQANAVTDDVPPGDPLGATMKFAKVTVTRFPGKGGQGKIRLFGTGFQAGQRIRVLLKLRTTHVAVEKHPPASKSTTFLDTTIQCGTNLPALPCFTARPSGKVAGSMTVSQCLADNGQPTALAKGNVEIVESGLVNCDTGKVVGRPGILD